MFILWAPTYVSCNVPRIRQSWCSLDPGVRTFMTGYDTTKLIEYGADEPKTINKYYKRLNKIKSCKKYAWYKRYASRIYEKMTNKVADLH